MLWVAKAPSVWLIVSRWPNAGDLWSDEFAAAQNPKQLLIFKDLHFRGIWINKWYNNATHSSAPLSMAKRGPPTNESGENLSIERSEDSLASHRGQRSGKIIFEFAA